MRAFYLTLVSLIFILTSCGKIEDPQFKRIDSFKIKQIGFNGTTIGFNITFFNPNKFGVSVKEAACDIYIDSLYAGKFSQDGAVDVGKQSEFSLPLTGNIPLATTLKIDVSKFINREILFQANGNVKVGKAGVFITRPFNYKGKHQINM